MPASISTGSFMLLSREMIGRSCSPRPRPWANCSPKAAISLSNPNSSAFGLQFAHGLGLGLHERPIISRLNSMKEPVELQVGMVFALETYCPASDGFSAARIEEEVVVTEDGPRILTLFPAQDLVVTNPY